jgi:serine/threonine-protein kinase
MKEPAAKAESLFVRALDLPPGSVRDAFVAKECAEDPAVHQEVRSLLRAHEEAGGFLTEESAPRLPGYRIEHKIGEGSLGVVYAAHDEKLKRRVALKVLRPTAGESLRRRVLNEARKAAALSDPAIVTVFSVLDDTNPPAIVMEWVEGFALDRFAEQLNPQQKAHLLREVARGLAAAHAHGLVHRDLKPDNIIVGPDMRPRILDFGLALLPEEAAGQPALFAGTPLYASPEQVSCKPLTPASDVFSFGSLMFKVLTGRPPFAGKTAAEVADALVSAAPPFPREVALGVPKDLQAICLACLARSPEDRPSAPEIVVELGRFLIGEPARLRPKLYDDLLRRTISEYSAQARTWQSQNIISGEENDALQGLHRRLLSEEDHWIIDARRVTLLQTILSGGTWLAVVATVLTVWILRNELSPLGRWLVPACFTLTLLAAGYAALRRRDDLAAATFLAGAVLATAPSCLALLGEAGLVGTAPTNVTQLFAGVFTNQQVLVASLTALVLSGFGLWRLKMTGFAWTTAALGTISYLALLMLFDWLDKRTEVKALWCLPLVGSEFFGLHLERKGRVRWTLPFHVVAVLALVGGLDTIALQGPTLRMLGVSADRWPYFDGQRLEAFSVALNGVLFLGLMLATERAPSLDLRRASKLLELLAILHILSALFSNALAHRAGARVRVDVWVYVASALMLVMLAALRSRWRMLVGGLAGCGLGSFLLVDLGVVERRPFIIGLGLFGLLIALGAFVYVQQRQGARRRAGRKQSNKS